MINKDKVIGYLESLDINSKDFLNKIDSLFFSVGKFQEFKPCKLKIQYSNCMIPPKSQVNQHIQGLKKVEFEITPYKRIISEEAIYDYKTTIGDFTYKGSLGGLHSNQKAVSYFKNDNTRILEIDVNSYYPSIIINNPDFIEHFGNDFYKLYKMIYEIRMESEDQNLRDICKLALNSIYGKLNTKGAYYSPGAYINIVFSGQFYLLFLIEAFTKYNIQVISTNTDSITIIEKTEQAEQVLGILRKWEEKYKFNTSIQELNFICYENVNSYIAQDISGELILKGSYNLYDKRKKISLPICTKAILNYLLKKQNIVVTIMAEKTTLADFLECSSPTNAKFKCKHNGKRVYYYYTKPSSYNRNANCIESFLAYGAKLIDSCKADPIDISSKPDDIDYSFYIQKTFEIANKLGIDIV